jgi:hypothetical protein
MHFPFSLLNKINFHPLGAMKVLISCIFSWCTHSIAKPSGTALSSRYFDYFIDDDSIFASVFQLRDLPPKVYFVAIGLMLKK